MTAQTSTRTPRKRVRGVSGNGAKPGVFDGYRVGPYQGAFDEMFDDGTVRAPYRGIYDALAPTDVEDLAGRSDALGRAFVDQGITHPPDVVVEITRLA